MPVAQENRQVAITVPTNKSEIVSSFNIEDFDVPTGREEDWRFTPLRRVKDLLTPSDTVDGATWTIAAAQAVKIEVVDRSDSRLGQVFTPVDRASVVGWQHFTHAQVVTIPADTSVDDPTVLTLIGTATSYQHVRVIAENYSSATVVLDLRGTGRHLTNFEVSLGDGAKLTLVSIQEWDRDAVQLGRIHSRVGREANLTQVVATFGGDTVRLVSTVDYAGPGAHAELVGAYFADAGQHFEHRLFVDHNQPHCRSDVIYKGALQGEHAHTVWIGDVLIRAHAIGTQTYEINRNLILTQGARADSVPNLEIETGEVVGAGHASTTGRFDDEQLFYLQSRGIDAEQARRLVVRGFFTDVIERIPSGDLRDRLWEAVEDEVRSVAGGSQ